MTRRLAIQYKFLSFLTFILCNLISTGQSKIESIDFEQPSKKDCIYLDSLLSNDKSLNSADKKKYITTLARFFPEHENYHLGLYYQDTLISLLKTENDIKKLADAYTDKSMIHDLLGQYPEALIASQKALETYKLINDQSGIASSYNDIGVIHYYRGEDSLSKVYLNQSGEIYKKLNDTSGLAIYFNNLANVYFEIGEGEKALDLYKKGYTFDIAMENEEGQVISLCNIGESYTYLKQYDKAENVLLQALALAQRVNDSWTLTVPLMSLGELYQQTNEYPKANSVLRRCLKICHDISALPEEAKTSKILYELAKSNGKTSDALFFLEKLKEIEDSIFNKDSERIIEEMEKQYQVNDKLKEIELLNKESKIKTLEYQQDIEKEKSNQKILIFGLIGIALILVLAITAFILKRNANNKLLIKNEIITSKNEELSVAYDEIELKNNEILDSIRYAKRIQSAILPGNEKLSSNLGDHFVLYMPKDVVAGDFYWLEKMEDKILFAVADCTGHGVPGAMVSVVCNNGLNRSVREHKLTDPGQILEKTRSIVLEEFEKSKEKVNDGMDIALCCLDGRTLYYAGAHTPLWIVRNGSYHIEEIKADKQPVGKFEKSTPFKTHKIELNAGDQIYLSSDGYADQFGGEKGKKLKTTNFKKLLLSLNEVEMNEKGSQLKKSFEEWRGDLEQIDDVCVLGLKI
jgi:serine phosphatase RsbU (regulator of sigma subunit)